LRRASGRSIGSRPSARIRASAAEPDSPSAAAFSSRRFEKQSSHTARRGLGSGLNRPEFKSDAPEGGPCARSTRGLLRRAHVEATGVVYIGEVLNEYADARCDIFATLTLPVLKTMPVQVICAESGLNRSSVKRIRAGRQRPRPRNMAPLSEIAARYAWAQLAQAGEPAPPDDVTALYLYLCRRQTD